MTKRDDDLRILSELLDQHADELTEREIEAFASMRYDLRAYSGEYRQDHLTEAQWAWLASVYGRVVPDYANLVSRAAKGRRMIGDGEWVACNFTRDRSDKLRLSVSLGGCEGGFKSPTWCWFVYDLKRGLTVLAQGTVAGDDCRALKQAQTAASDWADRHSGRICTRCGMTETEIENASDRHCDGPTGTHPEVLSQDSQHHFPQRKDEY